MFLCFNLAFETLQTSDITSPPPLCDEQGDSTQLPPSTRRRIDVSSPVSSRVFSPPSTNAIVTSELDVDLSSPLNFGTPSSKIGGVESARGYVCAI